MSKTCKTWYSPSDGSQSCPQTTKEKLFILFRVPLNHHDNSAFIQCFCHNYCQYNDFITQFIGRPENLKNKTTLFNKNIYTID